MLPDFTTEGILPPCDYSLTLDQLRSSMLVVGPGAAYPTWDAGWRRILVDNLSALVRQLWNVGVNEIFVDGSFVEDKDHPNDIDGYFVCERERLSSGTLQRDLNLLDPYKIWTWDPTARRPIPGSTKKQLPMWLRYRVELFPHVGQLSGLRDRFGNELEFPAAFRQSSRARKPKGIIQIIKQEAT